MKVIRNLSEFPKLDNVVVTNGTFDGCHIGHQKILEQLKKSTKAINGKSVVLTYWPHPRIVLGKENNDFKLLYTIDERIEILSKYDIDYLVILEFTLEFAQQSSQEFIQNIITDKLNTSKLIIGYNHRFGKNREGGFDYLVENSKKFSFDIEEIPKQIIKDEGISSTRIRKALHNGDVTLASKYLDSRFCITGKVIKGNQIGRKIGFPTANIEIKDEFKIIPKDGVYAVYVWFDDKKYKGIMNIGFKPSIDDKLHTKEVYILDFDKDIYGESLKIEFVKRIRDEQKFDSIDELKVQIENDKQSSLKFL